MVCELNRALWLERRLGSRRGPHHRKPYEQGSVLSVTIKWILLYLEWELILWNNRTHADSPLASRCPLARSPCLASHNSSKSPWLHCPDHLTPAKPSCCLAVLFVPMDSSCKFLRAVNRLKIFNHHSWWQDTHSK